jgi:apoptosis-inducing factor 3
MNDGIAPIGPDFALGVLSSDVADGSCLAGHVGKKEVLLVRRGEEFFAVDARCTHYHGPLAEGILVGDTVRCPWHHARFDLRTGEAIGPPALSPVKCWDVDHGDGKVYVRRRRASAGLEPRRKKPQRTDPEKIAVVGGGAAGFAAVEMLRREQYQGSLVMLSADSAPPVDRPNLSKDYLAGSAPEDWLPLRPETFYSDNNVDLRLDAKVVDIDARSREITLGDGSSIGYDRLLLATGAEPRSLSVPGSARLPVLTLRSLADCHTIIRHAQGARRVVVVGASFIGLEVAAALRARDIEVHVVAPEKRPMERILGPQMGEFIRALHEEHGVVFHLEDEVSLIDGLQVRLRSGHILSADFVVAGIGVQPRTDLAERAGLDVDGGVIADAFLASNVPDIFVAGDIARWPDPHSGESIRVEHWVVAERQGQTAARNMLGYREKFTAVPFFWSQHYDLSINYVGHAAKWDEITIEGDIASRDCVLRFKNKGHSLAVASIFRDVDSLEAELAMEGGAA